MNTTLTRSHLRPQIEPPAPRGHHSHLAQPDVPWLKRPTPLAFLDPSFSTGGDAAAATFALLGDAQVAGKTITILKKVATMDLMMILPRHYYRHEPIQTA